MFGEIKLTTWALLFVVYFIYDIVYTKYILSVSKLNPFQSANLSIILYMLTAYGTIQYIQNYWNVVPIVLASWLGTYLVLKYELNKTIQKPSKKHRYKKFYRK